jgi:hypothetical protein
MKLPAAMLGLMTASTLSIAAGVGYIADCRLNGGAVDACWLTGLPIMGLGGGAAAGGAAGWRAGYNTYNPSLRKPRNDHESDPA